MATLSSEEVTQLLVAWSNGDKKAMDQLMPLVYQQLHRLARRRLVQEGPGHTLQTTALVHEAYLRLVGQKKSRWQNRAHFYAIAAQMMRRVLVDYARNRRCAKRGGGAQKMSFDEMMVVSGGNAASVVAVDEALTTLAQIDERKSKMVELRFFGGLSIEETAAVLGVSTDTIRRDWTFTKVWLQRAINGGQKK